MRIVHYVHAETAAYGLATDAGVARLPLQRPSFDALVDLVASGRDVAVDTAVPWEQVTLLPPLTTPGKMLCVGLNFIDHMLEAKRPRPERPVLFTRFADTLVAHGAPLIKPTESDRFDYEGELAIVIGAHGWKVPPDEALDLIFGYSCYNDATARDWQYHSSQWTPGKNFPSTAAFGPCILTAAHMPPLSESIITTRVNGEERQKAALDSMIFGLSELLSYITSFTPLAPGDVIACGTPSGVGNFSDPPRYLLPGDVVEVEISEIGTLRNTVVEHADSLVG